MNILFIILTVLTVNTSNNELVVPIKGTTSDLYLQKEERHIDNLFSEKTVNNGIYNVNLNEKSYTPFLLYVSKYTFYDLEGSSDYTPTNNKTLSVAPSNTEYTAANDHTVGNEQCFCGATSTSNPATPPCDCGGWKWNKGNKRWVHIADGKCSHRHHHDEPSLPLSDGSAFFVIGVLIYCLIYLIKTDKD